MTAINFPANPSNGDTHEGFVYNSTLGVWQSAGAGTSFTGLSDTPSTLGTAGQIAKVNSGGTALEFADQSGVTVYATADLLPGSANAGDMAFVTATNRLYLWTGTGWYNIALINTNPNISGVSSSYDLASDGTATVITITATDPEGVPITYSIASDTSGNIATVTQGTGASSNVFTITPSTDSANSGSFILTFRASDGVNIASALASFVLEFSVQNSNYTTALITSVGTNNAVNNTFVDSSTNNQTITVNGDVHQTTFSPYRHGGYSTYFDGTGDFLSATHHSSFDLGSDDFTIETWMYLTGYSNSYGGYYASGICGKDDTTTRSYTFSVSGTSNTHTGLYFNIFTGGSPNTTQSSTSFNLNQWYHVAVSRESGTLKLFVDGVVVQTNTSANQTPTAGAQPFVVGAGSSYSSYEYRFPGYLADFRFVKGTAVYTGTFTPPTERLTAITNTSLLTCHLPYIADGSTIGHNITVNGDTKTESFAPYDYSKYSSSDHGGSMYFDGSGDKLTIPGTYANFGTNPFTVEAWVYPSSSVGPIFTTHRAGTASGFYFSMSTSNNTMIHGRYYGSNVETGSSANAVKLNQWNHLAWCREGTGSNQTRMFANGKVVATYTDDQDYSSAPYGPFVGGYDAGGSQYDVNGNIADLRVVSGTALYTAEFTPPTAPLTAITNTSLLLSGTNAGIIDKSQSVQTLTLNGNVSSSTTQSKYLTSSMYFDGTGDYILLSDSDIREFGGGDLTIELWFKTSIATQYATLISNTNAAFTAGCWTILMNNTTSGGEIAVYLGDIPSTGTLFATTGVNVRDDAWHHLALVRNGNSWACYVDGTSRATTTFTGSITNRNADICIGADQYYGRNWEGYMSDVRITKGLARYTANFTPPTAELKG